MLQSRFRGVPVVVLLFLLVGIWPAAAQPAAPGRETSAESVARYATSDLMPIDPEAVIGTLPNGLRYYVRRNDKPARGVSWWRLGRQARILRAHLTRSSRTCGSSSRRGSTDSPARPAPARAS